ncbi:peroxiredoxin [Tsukamurella pulmonis]|uniref:thioredoxin-dependent peroxiredoxin n=1 Tax=Tsukamurella pulmonis TaxID=47312 RepID=A0A1H1CDQ6_9ACTN|nr:peroxiredoxin-like family protein [Tsukamurella pulmonis]KXO89944.1 peroxiredoxin [Tsukamurella pulmonis]SDQ62335.1 Peroxiredoxin [Tsukamurella pulmonis]SUP23829.1 thioredoxin-dependent thiol peroxidase [Tsukamurella pulmonis]
MSTVNEALSALKAHAAEAGGPMEAFTAEQRALAESGPGAGVARPGTPVPDGPVLDPYGAETTLAQVLGDRPAVLVFYRGAWCPYCNLTLHTYQTELAPALAERGVQLIAISPQTPDGSLSTAEKNELTFTVLSDPGLVIADGLGIVTTPSDEARAAQLDLGLDVTQANADGTTRLPHPSTVLVDGAHVVRWIDVHPDYTTATEPSAILAAVDAL